MGEKAFWHLWCFYTTTYCQRPIVGSETQTPNVFLLRKGIWYVFVHVEMEFFTTKDSDV